MPENTIVIPDSVIEQLHCSVCNGYLSCGPIRLLSNGSCICGQCSPPVSDVPIAREVAFEAVLSNLFFPCRYKQHGCAARLLFGKAIDHELKCMYRSFTCPSSALTACSWKGSTTQMLDHFTDKHSDLVKLRAEFKFQVNQDAEEIFVVKQTNVGFIVKYVYDPKESLVKYDVRFCTNSTESSASYRLQLINDSDPELSFSLKTNSCCAFDDSFYGVQTSGTLNLNKYLLGLNNPECVLVCINLVVPCDKTTIDTLRCGKCFSYLVPPLFEFEGSLICCYCAETNNCKPVNDTKLLERVATAEFPCRWRNCECIVHSSAIKTHELQCKFRQHDCFFGDCTATYILDKAVDHCKRIHGTQYLSDSISFDMSFSTCFSNKHIINIKDNLIVLLEYSVEKSNEHNALCLTLFTSEQITGNIVFEHQHCKLKSKQFTLVSRKLVRIALDSNFPPCFKANNMLTAAIYI